MTRETHQPPGDPDSVPVEVDRPSEVEAPALDDLARALDLTDPQAVLFFGSKVQHRLSRISRKMLEQVAAERVADAGAALDEMLAVIREFDFRQADPNVRPPWWKRWWPGARPLRRLLDSIRALRRRVEETSLRLEREKTALLTDVVAMGKLDQKCRAYLDELDRHLAAARLVIDRGDAGARAPELLQRVTDLSVSRQVGQQARASLLLVQDSGRELISRVNFVLTATVPAWQQHMAQLVAIWRKRRAADAVEQARAIGEDMASAGADLREARERVRRALRQGVYDLDAIAEANEQLGAALEEGREMAARGREARAQALATLQSSSPPDSGASGEIREGGDMG